MISTARILYSFLITASLFHLGVTFYPYLYQQCCQGSYSPWRGHNYNHFTPQASYYTWPETRYRRPHYFFKPPLSYHYYDPCRQYRDNCHNTYFHKCCYDCCGNLKCTVNFDHVFTTTTTTAASWKTSTKVMGETTIIPSTEETTFVNTIPEETTIVTTAENTTPQVTTEEIISTENTTPEITSEENTSPQVTTAENTTPEVTTEEKTTAESTTPEVTTAETTPEVTTEKITTAETTPQVTTEKITTAESTTPRVTTAESTTPEETLGSGSGSGGGDGSDGDGEGSGSGGGSGSGDGSGSGGGDGSDGDDMSGNGSTSPIDPNNEEGGDGGEVPGIQRRHIIWDDQVDYEDDFDFIEDQINNLQNEISVKFI